MHCLKNARQAVMLFAHILMLHPWANGKENGSLAVPVIRTVLHVVLDHKDHCIFPARAMRNKIDRHAEGGIVVLHEPRIRPRRAIWENVERATAMIVGVVKIDVRREVAHIISVVHIAGFKYLLKATKAAKPSWIRGQGRVGNGSVELGIKLIAIVADYLLHRHIHMITNSCGIGSGGLVHFCEFVAVAEVDKRLAISK